VRKLLSLAIYALVVFAACGDDASETASSSQAVSTASATNTASSSTTGAGGSGGAESCHGTLGPADAERFVVIGHPYDPNGGSANTYEVLRLATDGMLSRINKSVPLGRPADRPIAFTPDGELGFSVQDDGSIGVFGLQDDGTIDGLESGFRGSFYADRLVVSADGSTLWVVDPNFPENGGGIYELAIACDGTLTDNGLRFPAKNAAGLAFDPVSGDFLVAARAALDSTGVAHAHRVNTSLVASVDVFGDDEALLSWMTLTAGGKHLLIGDNSSFSSVPNRVGAVPITASGLGTPQVLSDIEDPYAIAASPFDDAAIVVSGFGDAIFVLGYDPDAPSPLTFEGELTYVAGSPQVPGALAMVERGALAGRVLVADVRGLFVVQFAQGATVTDIGVFDLGGGTENIVSGVGITP
jgi:hypothetical protein